MQISCPSPMSFFDRGGRFPAIVYVAFILLGSVLQSSLEANQFTVLEGNPGLRSASAIVIDRDGNVIYDKDADTVRSIASITKLMTAIVVLDGGQSLDEPVTVTKDDRDLVRLTGSRLEYGATLPRKQMLLLALMASENRAASALGRTYPGGTTEFVRQMNAKAGLLGMQNSQFADPVGLRAENRSTARDLARLAEVARTYPLIAKATTTRRVEVRPYSNRGPLSYVNTNRLLKNTAWDISLSKTGYISEAGRCLVMEANIDGEDLYIVFLDSFGKLTPFGDSNRLRHWLLGE
jgi:D-alanyl-D-alanine endopeptidase (penicillin-binding protein 7)